MALNMAGAGLGLVSCPMPGSQATYERSSRQLAPLAKALAVTLDPLALFALQIQLEAVDRADAALATLDNPHPGRTGRLPAPPAAAADDSGHPSPSPPSPDARTRLPIPLLAACEYR